MKKILFILLLAISTTVAIAGNADPKANQTIKGQVTDENGEALAGVEVMVEGIGTRVYTDFDGNFEIDHLRDGSYTIVLTLISFKDTKTVLKTKQNEITPTVIKLNKKRLQ